MTTLKEKIGYGLCDMSTSIVWRVVSYYLPIFYSVVCKLDLLTVGTLLLVTRLWEAFLNVMMGAIVDRVRFRWGRFRSWLIFGVIPFAISGFFLFTTPDNSENRLIWAYITYIAITTAYTIIEIPYTAMLNVVTDVYSEKTTFASFKTAFAYLGGFLVLGIWHPLCEFFGGEDNIHESFGWQMSMIVLSVICIFLLLASFRMVKEKKDEGDSAPLKTDFKNLMNNFPWWILTASTICMNLFNTFRGTTIPFCFQHYFGDIPAQVAISGIFLSVGEMTTVIGIVFFATQLARRYGKKNTLVACGYITMCLSILFMFLPPTTWGLVCMLILQALMGIATGIVAPLIWSMYADVADYSLFKNSTPSTALIFSSGSMALRLGGAVGGALVIWLLNGFGLDMESTTQSDTAIMGLRACMSLYPAGIAFIMAITMKLYPLDHQEMEQIHSTLTARESKEFYFHK